MTCTPRCWTPVRCPDHDHEMTPAGRAAALEVHICCDLRMDPEVNPRHLWHEHDSTRWYADPDGWDAHVAACEQCRGDV